MMLRLRACWVSVVVVLGSAPLICVGSDGQLRSSLFLHVAQSSDVAAANTASQAVDGAGATFSLTGNFPGSWWTAELGRPFTLTRIEVVNRSAPFDRELDGLTLRLFNLDDQVVFQTALTNPGAGATLAVALPARTRARSLWIGLIGAQTNGGGNHRVGLAEVRVFGDLSLPFGPDPVTAPTNAVKVWQSSDYSSSFPASYAIDNNAATFTHTANLANSYWMADLGTAYRIDRVELVNRSDCCAARLGGVVLRMLDGSSNSVASAVLPNAGLGGAWATNFAGGKVGRYLRVALEDGQTNSDGNY